MKQAIDKMQNQVTILLRVLRELKRQEEETSKDSKLTVPASHSNDSKDLLTKLRKDYKDNGGH